MEADISTWQKTGHFYFALTQLVMRLLGAAQSGRRFPETPSMDSNGMVRRFYRASGLLREACRVGVQWNYVDERILDGGGKLRLKRLTTCDETTSEGAALAGASGKGSPTGRAHSFSRRDT
jgi:hypothetical protein